MTSKTLRSVVADANVLLSAVIGGAARMVFERARVFRVVTTDVAEREVRRHLPAFATKAGISRAALVEALELLTIEIVGPGGYRMRLEEAEGCIAHRDPDDVSVLALALRRGLPIWSNDDDFDEAALTVYTTAELLKELGFSSKRRR